MKVTVNTSHFRKAKSYSSNRCCPLAEALKEQLPFAEISVGGCTVDIDHKKNLWFTGWSSNELSTDKIDKYITQAKEGKEVPSFEVEIEGI